VSESTLTVEERTFSERTSAEYTALVADEDGNGIDAADLDTLTLTLSNLADGSIINSRNAQNVLNANNVTVDAEGNLVWSITPSDTVMVRTAVKIGYTEKHRALFRWTWDGGAKAGSHEMVMLITNVAKVT